MKSVFRSITMCFLFVAAIGLQSFATGEDYTSTYNNYVLEFEKHMFPKMMSKEWKKRGAGWRTEVGKSKDVASLAKLTIEFESMISDKAKMDAWTKRNTGWKGDLKGAANYAQLGDLLIEMEEGIKNESKIEAWTEKREEWIGKITISGKESMMAVEAVIIDEAELSAAFDKAWGATANSFKDMKTGDGKVVDGLGTLFGCNAKFPQAKSTSVVQVIEDDSDNFRVMVIYDAGQYKENAQKMFDELAAILGNLIPSDYPRKDNYIPGYVDQKVYLWDFASDNFADVAKKPSVTIGMRESNGKYAVELLIMEPVFK